MRCAPARPMITMFTWLETWPMAPANCLVMFRNGTTMLMLKAMPEMLMLGAPASISAPPTSATTTYITLPMLPSRGIRILAKRLPLRALKKISPLTLSKSALAPSSWQNTLMTFWPVIISSIKASALASVTCWRRKYLEEWLVI